MRSSLLFLFLPLQLLTLDLGDVNEKALTNETKTLEDAHKLDCIKDIGVSPLPSLRSVKPYYQIFILDLTTPMETFARIRLLFVQAVCLYAGASNHIRIGYIALVNKHKVSSEPSIPDIREFIGMWTEPDEKLLNGVAKSRQDTPLTHCEKADLLGHIINRFKKMTAKPFRFLIIDDQKPDDQTNADCDQAYEFGKALWRRNISLDNFILDEVISREQDHSSGRRMSKAPIFTMGSLDDTEAFMKGMKTYIEALHEPESWSSEGLKSMMSEMELNEQLEDDVVIEFPHAASNFSLQSEENMTSPDLHDDDDDGVGVKVAAIGIRSPPPEPNATIVAPSLAAAATAATAAPAAALSKSTDAAAATTETTTNATTAAAAAKEDDDSPFPVHWIILIVILVLLIAFVLFVIFCCWYDKKKLKNKMDKGVASNTSVTAARNDNNGLTTPLIGTSSKALQESSGSSSKRPLRLTKSNHVTEAPPDGAAPLVEKNLPDPYSPVKYMNTPVPMPSEIEMTHTEHVAPPTMDEALNKHVATPMEKVPELHIDDYNI